MKAIASNLFIFLLVFSVLGCNKPSASKEEKEANEVIAMTNAQLKNTPDDPELYYYQASAYLVLKQFDRAITLANTGIELKKDFPLLYCVRGDAYFFLKRYAEAETDYKMLVKLFPAWDAGVDRLNAVQRELEYDNGSRTSIPNE